MPSFPGTVKVWTTKVDLVDTVFAAHVNDLQSEVSAVETVLGVNPQGTYATVADRLANVDTNVVHRTGAENVGGVKTFTSQMVGQAGMALAGTADLTPGGTTRYLLNNAGIGARNLTNTTSATLPLQPLGGDVTINGHKVWHAGNDGSGSGLDADLLDGHNLGDFLQRNGGQATLNNFVTIPFATFTDLPYTVVTKKFSDTGDMFTGSPWMLCRAASFYAFTTTLWWDSVPAGLRAIRLIQQDGTVVDQTIDNPYNISLDPAHIPSQQTFTTIVAITTPNTFVKFQVYQSNHWNPSDPTGSGLPLNLLPYGNPIRLAGCQIF